MYTLALPGYMCRSYLLILGVENDYLCSEGYGCKRNGRSVFVRWGFNRSAEKIIRKSW